MINPDVRKPDSPSGKKVSEGDMAGIWVTVGTADVKDVHCQKMIHIGGPGLFVSQVVQNSTLHDLQRFLVEPIDDWRVETDGTVKVLIKW